MTFPLLCIEKLIFRWPSLVLVAENPGAESVSSNVNLITTRPKNKQGTGVSEGHSF